MVIYECPPTVHNHLLPHKTHQLSAMSIFQPGKQRCTHWQVQSFSTTNSCNWFVISFNYLHDPSIKSHPGNLSCHIRELLLFNSMEPGLVSAATVRLLVCSQLITFSSKWTYTFFSSDSALWSSFLDHGCTTAFHLYNYLWSSSTLYPASLLTQACQDYLRNRPV